MFKLPAKWLIGLSLIIAVVGPPNMVIANGDFASKSLPSYAVIDRIVDDSFAVILTAPGDQETIIRLSLITQDHFDDRLLEGTWGTLHMETKDERVLRARFVLDPHETADRLARIGAKVVELRSRRGLSLSRLIATSLP